MLPWSLPDLRYRVGFLNGGTTDIFLGGGPCCVYCRVATCLAFSPQDARIISFWCDNQRRLEPLPNVPCKEKLLPVENQLQRKKTSNNSLLYFYSFSVQKAPACFNSAGKKKKKERMKRLEEETRGKKGEGGLKRTHRDEERTGAGKGRGD